jgi:hypothetical protein
MRPKTGLRKLVHWSPAIATLGMLLVPLPARAITVPSGQCYPPDSTGCWKITNNGTGIGISVSADGVAIDASSLGSSGCGLSGTSVSGAGISASGERGVDGRVQSDTWPSVAVKGTSDNQAGVGVYATATDVGAYGQSTNSYGAQGFSDSANGIGVQANSSAASGYGVHALCSGSCATGGGLAGHFVGNVTISGASATGGLTLTGGTATKAGGGLWQVASDARVKKDVRTFKGGWDELARVDPVHFKYNGLGGTIDDGTDYVGVIAQDLEKVAPSMVSSKLAKLRESDAGATQIKQVDGTELIYMLINAVNDQQRSIEHRATRIARLERSRAPSPSRDLGLGLAFGLLPLGLVVARSARKGA